MGVFKFCLAIFCSVGVLCCAQGEEAPPDFESLIQSYVEEERFRGVVLVAKDGNVLHHKAYGYADEQAGRKNTTDTQFLIGSLTKSFTAVATMKLVEQGKLDLNAPLERYIPNLASQLRGKLTLHTLLKHQSGLPVHLERLVSFENKDVGTDEILKIINTTSPEFEPGSAYQYGNLNYHLIAIALENVTNLSFSELLKVLVFTPLDMQNSGVERLSNPAPTGAQGYRKSVFGLSPDNNIVSYAVGSGDVYSTALDLLHWEQALYSEDYLSAASTALLFKGEKQAFGYYGYGFRIRPYQRGKLHSDLGVLARHGGSMDGFYSNLHRYLDDRLTVIILANVRPFPIRQMTFELKELALGLAIGERHRKQVE